MQGKISSLETDGKSSKKQDATTQTIAEIAKFLKSA